MELGVFPTISIPNLCPVTNGHKKGVEIISLFYLVIWSWSTNCTDKTIAPTPILLYCATQMWRRYKQSTQVPLPISSSYSISKRPSSITEDKISITPFVNM